MAHRESVHREVAPCGRNMNIVAINQEMGLVHHQLGQFTVTRNVFQNFTTNSPNKRPELFPGEDHIHIIHDGARPHLNIVALEPYEEHFTLRMLPSYSPFLNSVHQAHSCFKTFIKNELARQEIQAQLVDDNARRAAGLNKQRWRCKDVDILLRLGQDCLGQVTMAKCAA